MAFTVSKIDHIGVACQDLDVSKKFYTDVLGLECTGEELPRTARASSM